MAGALSWPATAWQSQPESLFRELFPDIRVGATVPPLVRKAIAVMEDNLESTLSGRGTGQGLSIAYATVVTKHGGSLSLESEVGRGTTFLVRVPQEGYTA